MLRGLRELVLAQSCLVCGEVDDGGPESADDQPGADDRGRICNVCLDELGRLSSAFYCPDCGHGTAGVGSCGVCASERPPVGTVVRTGAYEGLLRQMIQRVKFQQATFLVEPLARRMLDSLKHRGLTSFDLATTVPLHWRHHWQRGYNQAWLLLKAMRRFGLRVPQQRLLRKVRHTRPQVGLAGEARRRNVRGVFAVRKPSAVSGRRILLVDDVLTTGATAGACAKALKRAGAAEVVVVVAAVAGVNQKS